MQTAIAERTELPSATPTVVPGQAVPDAPSAEEVEELVNRPTTLRDLIESGAEKVEPLRKGWFNGAAACFLGTALVGAKERGLL